MKRLFCILLAMLLTFGMVLSMSACNQGDDTSDTTTGGEQATNPEPPAGNVLYEGNGFCFAYPETWKKTNGSPVILNSQDSGNNITIVFEDKTDVYKNMTLATFDANMRPAFELLGLTISDVHITQTENANGVAITKMTYTATNAATSMDQTIYAFDVGDFTYSVTVTEVETDSILVQTVFNTLYVSK